MRRYISLACVALIVVTCMVSPVRAYENSLGYFDLMEYGYILVNGVESTDFYLSGSSGTLRFPSLPPAGLGQIEMLIYTDASDIYFYSDGSIELSTNHCLLGSNYYVVTGNLRSYSNIHYLMNSASYCIILDAYCMPSGYSVPEIPFNFQMFNASDGELLSSLDNVTRVEYRDIPQSTSSDNSYYRQFRIYPDKVSCGGLDYIDLDFYVQNLSIDSISASFGGNALSVSYLSSFISDGVMNDSINTGEVGSDKTYGIYKVVVRIDISGISLVDGLPCIFVTYNANDYYGFDPYVYIYGINGGKNWDQSDPYVFYFRSVLNSISTNFNSLKSWISDQTLSIQNSISSFQSLFNQKFGQLNQWLWEITLHLETAIRGDTAPGDSFQDEVDQKDQQLNDMAAVMDSVARPDLNSVNVSADSYVDGTVLAASMSGITNVIGAPVFLDVIMMSLIMATAGYVLFGKR